MRSVESQLTYNEASMNTINTVSRRQFLNTLPVAAGAVAIAAALPQLAMAAVNLDSHSAAYQLGEHLGLQARAILGRPARATLLQFEFSGVASASAVKQGLLSALNLSGPEMAARSGGAVEWRGPVDAQAATAFYAVVGIEGSSQTAVIQLTNDALQAVIAGASPQSLQACGECRVLVA
jgi:hypothetical protein